MDLLIPEMGLAFWTVISILLIALPILALYSVLQSTFKDRMTKFIWVLVILFVPVIGPALYFLIGRSQRMGTI